MHVHVPPLFVSPGEIGEANRENITFIFTNPSNIRIKYLLDIQYCPQGLCNIYDEKYLRYSNLRKTENATKTYISTLHRKKKKNGLVCKINYRIIKKAQTGNLFYIQCAKNKNKIIKTGQQRYHFQKDTINFQKLVIIYGNFLETINRNNFKINISRILIFSMC